MIRGTASIDEADDIDQLGDATTTEQLSGWGKKFRKRIKKIGKKFRKSPFGKLNKLVFKGLTLPNHLVSKHTGLVPDMWTKDGRIAASAQAAALAGTFLGAPQLGKIGSQLISQSYSQSYSDDGDTVAGSEQYGPPFIPEANREEDPREPVADTPEPKSNLWLWLGGAAALGAGIYLYRRN